MKTFAIVLLAFALQQAAPLMANAGTDSAGASTSSSSGANGDGAAMSSSKSAPGSTSQSTQRRQGLSDNKSDCAKTRCVDSN